jgi:dCMP deaminase
MASVKRISKIEYYMSIARTVSLRSTCLRRHYGAVIVKMDALVSSGYNGAPRGLENCNNRGVCYRQENKIPHGANYELCRSVHAEQNAIINAARTGQNSILDGDIYIYGSDPLNNTIFKVRPCIICSKFILNSGIKKVHCCCGSISPESIEIFNSEDIAGMCGE